MRNVLTASSVAKVSRMEGSWEVTFQGHINHSIFKISKTSSILELRRKMYHIRRAKASIKKRNRTWGRNWKKYEGKGWKQTKIKSQGIIKDSYEMAEKSIINFSKCHLQARSITKTVNNGSNQSSKPNIRSKTKCMNNRKLSWSTKSRMKTTPQAKILMWWKINQELARICMPSPNETIVIFMLFWYFNIWIVMTWNIRFQFLEVINKR